MASTNRELYHYGVKGMKWGVRRTPEQLGHKKKTLDKSVKSDRIKSTVVQDAIRTGKVKKEINQSKQLRHTFHGHTKGRSYLNGDLDFAQALIDKLSGTGEAIFDMNGKWTHRERVVDTHIIGTHVNFRTGKETKTNKAVIIYSRTGTHIYPRKDEQK